MRMKRTYGFWTATMVALLLLWGCGEQAEPFDSSNRVLPSLQNEAIADERPVLHIAVTAMISPKATRTYYEALVRRIGDRMGCRVVFSQRRTYAEVNSMLKRRELDLAFVCSGPYVKGHAEFGLELLAVPIVHGKRVYHSYIIARRAEHAHSFPEFRGMRFAFTDPDSNTGWLVPTYMLAQLGETPKTFFSSSFFSGSHDASIRAVADGLACGAAVDSLIWDFIKKEEPALMKHLHVVEKSPAFGIPPVVVHPDLPADLRKELEKNFLTLHEDEEIARLLKKLQIDRFEKGNDSDYDSIREMKHCVSGAIE